MHGQNHIKHIYIYIHVSLHLSFLTTSLLSSLLPSPGLWTKTPYPESLLYNVDGSSRGLFTIGLQLRHYLGRIEELHKEPVRTASPWTFQQWCQSRKHDAFLFSASPVHVPIHRPGNKPSLRLPYSTGTSFLWPVIFVILLSLYSLICHYSSFTTPHNCHRPVV